MCLYATTKRQLLPFSNWLLVLKLANFEYMILFLPAKSSAKIQRNIILPTIIYNIKEYTNKNKVSHIKLIIVQKSL